MSSSQQPSVQPHSDPQQPHRALRQSLWQDGVATRRAVLGDAYVDASLKNATDYTMPIQEVATEWVWGNIWSRPGLDKKQRSLLVIAMTIAQNQWNELALHTRGAINNGLTELEIREAVVMAAAYCGMPAGLEAITATKRVIDDMVEKGEYVRPTTEKKE